MPMWVIEGSWPSLARTSPAETPTVVAACVSAAMQPQPMPTRKSVHQTLAASGSRESEIPFMAAPPVRMRALQIHDHLELHLVARAVCRGDVYARLGVREHVLVRVVEAILELEVYPVDRVPRAHVGGARGSEVR